MMQQLGAEMARLLWWRRGQFPELGLLQVAGFSRERSVEGIISARTRCENRILREMNMAGSVRLLGPVVLAFRLFPLSPVAATGSRAHEIAGWTGHHWSYAKSRLDSTAANLPRRCWFSMAISPLRAPLQSRIRGWIPMAGPGRNIVGGSHFPASAP